MVFVVIKPNIVKPLGLHLTVTVKNPPNPRRFIGTKTFNNFPVCGYSVPQGSLALALKPMRDTPNPNWGKKSTS